jgi:hypothetical protein
MASRFRFFQVMHYLRKYPTLREWKVLYGETNHSNIRKMLGRRIAALYRRLMPVLRESWSRRHEQVNPCSDYFDGDILGSIDTFPIYVNRPVNSFWQTCFYQGKYKVSVLLLLPCFRFLESINIVYCFTSTGSHSEGASGQ